MTKFDPWDWLGIDCGGFDSALDSLIIGVMEDLRDGIDRRYSAVRSLICCFLCNTDAFEFDDDPTNLRFVGDDRFKTLDDLIDAWDEWYEERHG